jgi:LacI family transcriptional regulator
MATIKDVAREAHVSIATVSRVFNNAQAVEVDTRRRVQDVAKRLRYVPNAAGRSLSTKKTDAIGLLLPALYGEFFSEVIRGCDEVAQANHYHLFVSSSHDSRDEIEAAMKMMRARVDGLIVMSPDIDARTLEENLPHSLPVVLLNCYIDHESFDSLNVDNFGGAFAMVQHLIKHGHKRIAIIKGNEKNVDARERLQGYRMSVLHGTAETDSALEISGDFSEASGYDGAMALMALHQRPTAVFSSNDAMAIGALRAFRERGIRVPDDIALAGFDDIPVAPYLSPALTSVHVGINRLGVLAVKTLLDAVRQRNTHKRRAQRLPTRLSLRESCGCKRQLHSQTIQKGR